MLATSLLLMFESQKGGWGVGGGCSIIFWEIHSKQNLATTAPIAERCIKEHYDY